MAEEFQEAEVIFHEYFEDDHSTNYEEKRRSKSKKISLKKTVPVNIPESSGRNSWHGNGYMDPDSDGHVSNGEMIPPHVIVGRRLAGKMMSFSVCTGNGRTLKGRDLSQVRNSVLKMTGFLEK